MQEVDANDYVGYIPKSINLKDKPATKLIEAIIRLLNKSATARNVELTETHILQAFIYFHDYNVNPLHNYTYYDFSQDGELIIGAKMSLYYLVASRSGLNAGNARTKFVYDAKGNTISATVKIYSKDRDLKKMIATTATVFYKEVKQDTKLWNDRPLQRLSQIAYVQAMRLSPMNDGSLSGIYTDVELEDMKAKEQPRRKAVKPKAKPKAVKTIKRKLVAGEAKAKPVNQRHKAKEAPSAK